MPEGNMRNIGPVCVWKINSDEAVSRAPVPAFTGCGAVTGPWEGGRLASRLRRIQRCFSVSPACRKNQFPRTTTPASQLDCRSTGHLEVRLTILFRSTFDTGASKNMSNVPFFDYLLKIGVITEDAHERLAGFSRWAREPIGMIAVQHGLIRNNEIDRVLDAQRKSKLRFGDLAVEMNLLSRRQVDRLLEVQNFRIMTDLFEALVLAGTLEHHEALRHLADFIHRECDAEACVESRECMTP
jgi:hypothetical protein